MENRSRGTMKKISDQLGKNCLRKRGRRVQSRCKRIWIFQKGRRITQTYFKRKWSRNEKEKKTHAQKQETKNRNTWHSSGKKASNSTSWYSVRYQKICGSNCTCEDTLQPLSCLDGQNDEKSTPLRDRDRLGNDPQWVPGFLSRCS